VGTQLSFLDPDSQNDLVNLREANEWATSYLKRKVTVSNLSYLIQYGRIHRHGTTGTPLLSIAELKQYYDGLNKENIWKRHLGEDLNWRLSFAEYKEAERTKHVHRLHPYKGKFIPQLVEYFLDEHIDQFKKQVFLSRAVLFSTHFVGAEQLSFKQTNWVCML